MEEQFLSSKTPSVLPYLDGIMTLLHFKKLLLKARIHAGGIINITSVQEKEEDFVSKPSPISRNTLETRLICFARNTNEKA